MIGSEPVWPGWIDIDNFSPKVGTAFEFDTVTLAVVEPDSFDGLEPAERPSEAGGTILATGEENERADIACHAEISSPQ
jgi:hypothetical protein